jgi:hypothetical protein
MKILNMIVVSTFATVVSFSALADQNHKSEAPFKPAYNTTQTMPMMGGNQGGMGMMQGNRGGMPMMGGNQGGMPMMHGNKGGMPMMMKMQQKQAMMQAHMLKMETHLANIEALLKELVELSKNK